MRRWREKGRERRDREKLDSTHYGYDTPGNVWKRIYDYARRILPITINDISNNGEDFSYK